ncbi:MULTISPECIES: hypothetical protein [Sphingomonas]|uniref:Uncharacterized protein n=1 Tax=Sphingomonas molluscorum TaxID=418184 RepID=A0ABU8Q7P8_9SPHN|nr:hypothetical protein [Sphingomonas sp. JUb134]MBM7407087.1 hypothetical protein [Sphingomonas sp. JUb134]
MTYRRPSAPAVRRIVTVAAVGNGAGLFLAIDGHPELAIVAVSLATAAALTILRYLVRPEGR